MRHVDHRAAETEQQAQGGAVSHLELLYDLFRRPLYAIQIMRQVGECLCIVSAVVLIQDVQSLLLLGNT